MAAVEIRKVEGRGDLRVFVDLPWSIYAGDPLWVPPIRRDVATLLTPGKHPFWDFAERELFLAYRDGKPVGRIAALIDGNYNAYHKEQGGAWGFFESSNEPEVAAALFKAAESWVRSKGMTMIRGPLNPSTNYEVGLLVQGFDRRPALMMTYNPSYYPELVRGCGYRKEKDLLAYTFAAGFEPPKWAIEIAEELRGKGEITVRTGDKSRLEEELRLINAIYHECWGDNWGFVPMTDAELAHAARDLMYVVDTDFVFFISYKGEAAGVGLLLPDVAPLLQRFNGKLGLSALYKKWRYGSEVTGIRGLLLGIKPEYRQMGLPLLAFDHLRRAVLDKPQYCYLELGWNLEDNQAINQLYEEEGGVQPSKRYRIYHKKLA